MASAPKPVEMPYAGVGAAAMVLQGRTGDPDLPDSADAADAGARQMFASWRMASTATED